ncbi:MAG: NAD(P)H-hydrate dehydratase [Gemmatimonadetes bacterium]|nr:NAD(P)H-hydrate dehydratase [Gemmatimonadota bacterium]
MTDRRPQRQRSRGRDVWGREHVALLTSNQSAARDVAAHEQHGVTGAVLMESAGRAAAQILDRLYPRGSIAVVAGGGNNGGDALVLARSLHAWGRTVSIFAAGSRHPDASLLHGHDLGIEPADNLGAAVQADSVLVDGLLGTGASGAPRGAIAEAIAEMNASGAPIVALDLPSGVDGTSGAVPGVAIRAAATIAFGWPKLGSLLHPGRANCGRLVAVEIGFPAFVAQGEDTASLITPDWAMARLPARAPDAHKGTAGRLLVLAGREGMGGAAAIAAEAASRAGAGLVRVASHASNRLVMQKLVPEATFVDREAIDAADANLMHALLAGPGIGTDAAARRALDAALAGTARRAVVLDADALNLFAQDTPALRALAAEREIVITPHLMELSRLTGQAVDVLAADAPAAARAASRTFGCTVLVKGQPSLIAAPGRPLLVNSVGSSDLATAGMGDQLAGAIGAFLAAGSPPYEAAALALFYCGRAADLAGLGRSLTPRDVSAHLAEAFRRPAPRRQPLRLPFVTFDQAERW